MTYVEALKVLNCTAIDQCGICLENKENGGKCLGQINFTEALEVAISALEKQIPKKPRMSPYNEKSKDEQAWFCPACNGYLTLIGYTAFVKSFENGFHCQHCGQAIDWSDTK